MTGIIVAAVALALATAFGLWRRATDGRARPTRPAATDRLGAAELGIEPGRTTTFVQFSSPVCTPCRRTRSLLESVAADHPEVAYVDLDATEHTDLTERFSVLRTPTVLVLDARGRVTRRIVGAARKSEVLALVGDPAPAEPTR